MIRLKSLLTEQQVVKSTWTSCKSWFAAGGTAYWNGTGGRPKIQFAINASGMFFEYNGPGTGYAIAHAKRSTADTLHQSFNVIVCEINRYLIRGGLKPALSGISANANLEQDMYTMNVWIPFDVVDPDLKYQLNRRGGWGHDPGANALISDIGDVKNLEGPVTVRVSGVNITEHFVTYTV